MNSCFAITDTTDWLRAFRQRVARKRIPFTGMLELTRRCNLRCRHCYLGNPDDRPQGHRRERTTGEIKQSIEEWALAGCLHLVITGGDPMMRKDFSGIYRHAVEQGLLVTVFCDGVLVTDDILELLRELPPRSVEISIYGATAPVYETVTRVPGSYAQAWKGIHSLIENGIRVVLKTVIMTLNQHELGDMAAQAEALGCAFRFDAAIFPELAGCDAQSLALRVSPETAVAWDLAFPERRARLAKAVDLAARRPPAETLYSCGAGNTAFYMDAYGDYSPCLMTKHYRYPGNGRSFHEIWNTDLSEIRQQRRTRTDGCLTGALRGACSHCPAFNYLETGDEEVDSDYMRETTERRYAAVHPTRKDKEVAIDG